VFLVDVVAITQASCAQPMNYYASMMVVCVGLKLALVVLLLARWVWARLSARDCRITRVVRDAALRRNIANVEASMAAAGRRRGSVAQAMAATLAAAQRRIVSVDWVAVFKASFMLLFIAYPGVSLKALRLFKRRNIEGVYWLAADMRLRCYDGRWAGFAIYGVIMAVLYVVGLPAAVLWILWRRRHQLFGSPTDPLVASTRETFGFLYMDYGSSAWWWEVEELARKLLLSAVVVLIEEGSPLQVTLGTRAARDVQAVGRGLAVQSTARRAVRDKLRVPHGPAVQGGRRVVFVGHVQCAEWHRGCDVCGVHGDVGRRHHCTHDWPVARCKDGLRRDTARSAVCARDEGAR
jgi:hypothetical protein